jgi:hypothetical protein
MVLFKVDNLIRGEYFLVAAGFSHPDSLHEKVYQICGYSESPARRGIGWQRIGRDGIYEGKFPEWSLSFRFSVSGPDTMYFAHLQPCTFSDLLHSLISLQPLCQSCILCKSAGGLDVPAIFWDAEVQKCVDLSEILSQGQSIRHQQPGICEEFDTEFALYTVNFVRRYRREDLRDGISSDLKPLIVIAGRLHPGESNSSFATEGLIQTVFGDSDLGVSLRKSFSWLIIPMVNPDGVVCGFYRPCLSGEDINRVWGQPDQQRHPIATAILSVIAVLHRTRPIPFFLDFHGYTALCNSFVYACSDAVNPQFRFVDELFPRVMSKHSEIFYLPRCDYGTKGEFETTMRMTLRRRFHILLAYTLEMSFGGCDFGARKGTQFTPHDYRSIGVAVARAIDSIFLNVN